MTLQEHTLRAGADRRTKRVGRGNGSGRGTYATRGCKGQNARTGGGVRAGFEGGQTPLFMKLPKMNGIKKRSLPFQVINVADLNAFQAGETVTPESLLNKKLVRSKTRPIKLLSDGVCEVAITVSLHAASQEAIKKLEKAHSTFTKLA